MCDSLCTGKGDWKVCCTGAVGGITGWAMGGNCGVGRRPKPGICPLGGSGTFWEEKTEKLPVMKKKLHQLSQFVKVKLYLCSEVTVKDQKPEKDEVGQAFRCIK